ncbi:MAG: hypothetical protein Q9216_006813, partial [Gyalolechia sp. 2 TL-2023]
MLSLLRLPLKISLLLVLLTQSISANPIRAAWQPPTPDSGDTITLPNANIVPFKHGPPKQFPHTGADAEFLPDKHDPRGLPNTDVDTNVLPRGGPPRGGPPVTGVETNMKGGPPNAGVDTSVFLRGGPPRGDPPR